MSDKIYNKNAREKALLEEAYSSVYNEQLNQEVMVGADVMWDGQRMRGQVEEVDLENGVAVVYDEDGGQHFVELDNFDVVLNPDTETPGDLKHHYGIDDEELAEGAMGDLATAAGKGLKSVGSGLGRLGAAGAGAVAAGTGAALGGILKVLDTLTAEQLTKIGNYALQKAAEDEENDVIKGDVPPPPTTDPNDPDYIPLSRP